MPYEIRDAETGEVIGRHRTRQGALDGWRTKHIGVLVHIIRVSADGTETAVLEGTWLSD